MPYWTLKSSLMPLRVQFDPKADKTTGEVRKKRLKEKNAWTGKGTSQYETNMRKENVCC